MPSSLGLHGITACHGQTKPFGKHRCMLSAVTSSYEWPVLYRRECCNGCSNVSVQEFLPPCSNCYWYFLSSRFYQLSPDGNVVIIMRSMWPSCWSLSCSAMKCAVNYMFVMCESITYFTSTVSSYRLGWLEGHLRPPYWFHYLISSSKDEVWTRAQRRMPRTFSFPDRNVFILSQ